MKKRTEQHSAYRHLEKMTIAQIIRHINTEDAKVAVAVQAVLPDIEQLIVQIVTHMDQGGRLFYIGAGTSGRLGILDASECPPTFGVAPERVIGLIAGGDQAIRCAVEYAEDDTEQAWRDLCAYQIQPNDVVVGIAASGSTPYVVYGLRDCQLNGITTGCITCNMDTPLESYSDFPIVVDVGPEFITGSTRMKAGTAQKMILNMITTASMIQLGYVKDHRMWNMQLSNEKLWERAVRMLHETRGLSPEQSLDLLKIHGSVRAVLKALEEE